MSNTMKSGPCLLCSLWQCSWCFSVTSVLPQESTMIFLTMCKLMMYELTSHRLHYVLIQRVPVRTWSPPQASCSEGGLAAASLSLGRLRRIDSSAENHLLKPYYSARRKGESTNAALKSASTLLCASFGSRFSAQQIGAPHLSAWRLRSRRAVGWNADPHWQSWAITQAEHLSFPQWWSPSIRHYRAQCIHRIRGKQYGLSRGEDYTNA